MVVCDTLLRLALVESFEYITRLRFCQFCLWKFASLQHSLKPKVSGVPLIIKARQILQIRPAVIVLLTVLVVDFFSIWEGADKGQGDESMHIPLFVLSAVAQSNSKITTRIVGLDDISSDGARFCQHALYAPAI